MTKVNKEQEEINIPITGHVLDSLRLPPTHIHPLILDFSEQEGLGHFQKLEVGFHELDKGKDYETLLREEVERLRPLYDTFSNLWGADLRNIATTRMLQERGFFSSIPVFTDTSLFLGTSQSVKVEGMPFFERGKRTLGDLVFSASYLPKIHDMQMGFSVLKVPHQDEYGRFEAYYPLFSFDSRILEMLKLWHERFFHNTDLSQNPILTGASQIASRRVHDWFHGSVIYDTTSKSSSLKRWSDDSFFVEHVFKQPGMINYEYMANCVHFQIWQKLFETKPKLKSEILDELSLFLSQVKEFETWLAKNDPVLANKIGEYLGFFVWRSIFDIAVFDSPEFAQLPYYHSSLKLLTQKEKDFLLGIYNFENELPFDSKSNRKLSVREIIDSYVKALYEEEKIGRLQAQISRFTTDIPDVRLGDVSLNQEFSNLPDVLRDQIQPDQIQNFDPWSYRLFNRKMRELSASYTNDLVGSLYKRVKIDPEAGLFYFELADTDFDFSNSSEVKLDKKAIFITIPNSFDGEIEWKLKRALSLKQGAVGTYSSFKAGDLICINVQNPFLISQLLTLQTRTTAQVREFFVKLAELGESTANELFDVFVYDRMKITQNYQTAGVDLDQLSTPIVFQSKSKVRSAVRCFAPVIVKRNDGLTFSSTSGAIIKDGDDIYPIASRNFEENYSGFKLDSLLPFTISENFALSLGSSVEIEKISQLVGELSTLLTMMNTIKVRSIVPSIYTQN